MIKFGIDSLIIYLYLIFYGRIEGCWFDTVGFADKKIIPKIDRKIKWVDGEAKAVEKKNDFVLSELVISLFGLK